MIRTIASGIWYIVLEPPPPQCGKSSCWREVGDSDPPKSTLCRSTNAPIGCSFARAPALNKPLIVGETGIKATNDATRTTRAPCCAHETATLAQSIQLLLSFNYYYSVRRVSVSCIRSAASST